MLTIEEQIERIADHAAALAREQRIARHTIPQSGEDTPDPVEWPKGVDADVREAMSARIEPSSTSVTRRRWILVGIAASVALIVGVGGTLYFADSGDGNVGSVDSTPGTIRSTVDELSTVAPTTVGEPEQTPLTNPAEVSTSLPPSTTAVDVFVDLPPDSVAMLPPAPIAGRVDPAAVWTGAEMIVWGGGTLLVPMGSAPFGDGAAFDPRAGAWRVLPPAPISARSGPAAVWSGSEMIVWGGDDTSQAFVDGAAYNPATDAWRTLPDAPIDGATYAAAVWTGNEMVVVGGFTPTGGGLQGTDQVAAYNPSTDSWRRLSDLPTVSSHESQAVWTGDTIVTVLTSTLSTASTTDQGAPQLRDITNIVVYDPDRNQWEVKDPVDGATSLVAVPSAPLDDPDLAALAIGYDTPTRVLDPRGDVTGQLTTRPTDLAGVGDWRQPLWTGREVLFWAGNSDGLAFDPTSQRWRTFPAGNVANRFSGAAMVWADGVMLGWGGFSSNRDGTNTAANDGIIYRPPDPQTPVDGIDTDLPDSTPPPEPTAAAEVGISRPYVDPDVCEPIAAREFTGTTDLEPFTAPTEFPIAMQVLANPDTGPVGPLALVLRYRDRPIAIYGDAVDVNGLHAYVNIYPNGNADARWNMPDGGQAYLRMRDLDRDTIIGIIESLTARDADAAIPGFDYEPDPIGGLGLELLDEGMNSGVSGSIASFACQTPNSDIVHDVQAVLGDPLWVYTYLLDQARPREVALVDGTLIVIRATLADVPFAADQVTNADTATWDALLAEPVP